MSCDHHTTSPNITRLLPQWDTDKNCVPFVFMETVTMPRMTIQLPLSERDALFQLARREYRNPREQAVVIIRRELQRRGLLPADDAPDARPAQEVQHANAT